MATELRAILCSQFEAALAMLRECIEKCPEGHWDSLIAKYPFWMVAYHTLCLLDCCLAPSSDAFRAEVAGASSGRPPDIHPLGMKELDEEYPSRRFSKAELVAYADFCRERLDAVLGPGGRESLDGPSIFSWLPPFSRAELHLHNMRHVQHHTGQLGASLRRIGVETRWIKAG